MARRIGEDPPAPRIDVQQDSPDVQGLRLRLVKVRHVNVEMELLRMGAVWPLRRDVIRHPLER